MAESQDRERVLLNGLRQINLQGEVVKGIKCVIKAVLNKKAKHVIYAADIDNKDVKEAIKVLCQSNSVSSDEVASRAELARCLNFAKGRNKNGEKIPKKGCSVCAVIRLGRDMGQPSVQAYKEQFKIQDM